MMPKRRKKPLMGLKTSTVIKCPGHLKWVRGHECSVIGKVDRRVIRDALTYVDGDSGQTSTHDMSLSFPHECKGRTEAHHSTTRGAGGGDETAVPLCAQAHAEGHQIGWETFEKRYKVDLSSIAEQLWKASPHGIRYRREREANG